METKAKGLTFSVSHKVTKMVILEKFNGKSSPAGLASNLAIHACLWVNPPRCHISASGRITYIM